MHGAGGVRPHPGFKGDGYLNVYPADGVGQVFEPGEVDLSHMVDFDPQQLLNGSYLQPNTAVVQGGVHLCTAVPGDIHPAITHNGDQVHPRTVFGDMHEHNSIGTLSADFSGIG